MKNNVRGKILHSQAKQIKLNVYGRFVEPNFDKSTIYIVDLVAELTGFLIRTVYSRSGQKTARKGILYGPPHKLEHYSFKPTCIKFWWKRKIK